MLDTLKQTHGVGQEKKWRRILNGTSEVDTKASKV
jgi:hypothetical protein